MDSEIPCTIFATFFLVFGSNFFKLQVKHWLVIHTGCQRQVSTSVNCKRTNHPGALSRTASTLGLVYIPLAFLLEEIFFE